MEDDIVGLEDWPRLSSEPLDFLAIDVETASAVRGSICQVGLAGFRAGRVEFVSGAFVDPECEFDPMNVWVHGITAESVRGAPRFADIADLLDALVGDRTVVAHAGSDKLALATARLHASLPERDWAWRNSLIAARRAWPDLTDHRLSTLADHCGCAFKHHDAPHDARAAGVVFARALEVLGLDVESAPVAGEGKHWAKADVRREPSGRGPLEGHRVVFTGDFSVPKARLADLFAEAGANVDSGVTRRTTMLVVGGRDASLWGGRELSGKHAKALEAIARGQSIRILSEAEARAFL